MVFVILLCCLFLGAPGKVLEEREYERWNQEIQRSVENNVFSCPFEFVQANQTTLAFESRNDVFLIYRNYPTSRERNKFQELPPTITKANQDFITEMNSKGYNLSDWGSKTITRAAIPRNHPGQNRSNCLRVSLLAGTAGPIYPAFYEEFKQVDRAFYLATMQNAYIHPTGLIFASCGEFHGVESCENCYPVRMKRKIHRCRRFLRKYKVTWSTLFQRPSSVSEDIWKYWGSFCSIPSFFMTDEDSTAPVPLEEEVFVLDAIWDKTYHHFIADSLARLAYHYDFLQQNKHIKLHLRASEDYEMVMNATDQYLLSAKRMRSHVFQLLDIHPSRLISGPILAKKVYIPRALRCSFAISNPIELRRISNYLIRAAHRYLSTSFPTLPQSLTPNKEKNPLRNKRKKKNKPRRIPVQRNLLSSTGLNIVNDRFLLPDLPQKFLNTSSIRWPLNISPQFVHAQLQQTSNDGLLRQGYFLVMQRYTAASVGNNTSVREWNDYQFAQLLYQLADHFPNYQIIPVSDYQQNQTDYCLACDIFLFSRAKALIGAHGSGFTNAMFLPPHSLLVEIVGSISALHMPVCGYHGVYAGIFGLHHFIFAYNGKKINRLEDYVRQIAIESAQFHQFLLRYQQDRLYAEERVHFHFNSTGSVSFRP